MTKYSISQIRQAHSLKKEFDRQFPFSYFVVRPVSFYLSYLLLLLTESPSRTAFAGFLFGIFGCFAFLVPDASVWVGILLLVAYDLMDASDGNIARVTGDVSVYGKFLDGVLGDVVENSYFLFLALALYLDSSSQMVRSELAATRPVVLVISAMVLVVCKLLGERILTGFHHHRQSLEAARPDAGAGLNRTVQTSTYADRWWYRVVINLATFDLQLLFLIVAASMSGLDYFFYAYSAFFLLQWMAFLVFYLRRASRTLYVKP